MSDEITINTVLTNSGYERITNAPRIPQANTLFVWYKEYTSGGTPLRLKHWVYTDISGFPILSKLDIYRGDSDLPENNSDKYIVEWDGIKMQAAVNSFQPFIDNHADYSVEDWKTLSGDESPTTEV